jgi:8-oxo-dGTP diphosphatase
MPRVTHQDPEAVEVKAAGGVVWRRAGDGVRDGIELAIAHRPRYDDWSFPKGKLDPGESWQAAALREVREEIGLSCRLGTELPPTFYTDRKDRSKAVRYWLMEPEAGEFAANEEVDEIRWLTPGEAPALLTYAHDHELAAVVAQELEG